MKAIQVLKPERFVRHRKEAYIKSGDQLINSSYEYINKYEALYNMSDDEIQDELNQNNNLLTIALELDLVHIRNEEGLHFVNYVNSFN